MTTLLELENEVLEAIGRPSDATAKEYAKRGLNAGIMLAGLLYEPPELRTNSTLIATTTQNHVDMSILTRLLRIEEVLNSTGGNVVWPLPFSRLNVFDLPITGNVKYYALHGNTLYYKPTPTVNETLAIHFLQYAAKLQDDGDPYPFSMHEDFALSIGIEMAFGFLEEGEMVTSWDTISERLGVPAQTAAQIRQALREEIDIGDIQRARE